MSCDVIRPELVTHIRGEALETRVDIDGHLASCPECAEERAALAELLDGIEQASIAAPPSDLRVSVLGEVERQSTGMSLAASVAAPPADLKARVLAAATAAAGTTAPAAPAPGPGTPAPNVVDLSSRRRLGGALSVAAAVVAIAVAAGAWLRVGQLNSELEEAKNSIASAETQLGPVGHETQVLAFAGAADAEGRLVHYRHDNFRLSLDVGNFPITPVGQHYALWLRGDSGDVAVGSFRVKKADDFIVAFPIGVDPARYPELVVTNEPNEGTPALEGEVISRANLDPDHVRHGRYDP